MDEIDFYLLRKLSLNSRLTFRELAELSNLSVSAVHKRINKLIEEGIIEGFIARPSVVALKYLIVIVFGSSKAKSLNDVCKELGQHENVESTAIGGEKFLAIVGFLRDISELQPFSIFVSETALMSEPIVGILNIPYITTPEPLTLIDYKILKYLNKDARKPIIDIAEDVGLSAKTVRKRLNRMIEFNLATFSIQVKPLYGTSHITFINLMLNEGMDIRSIINEINSKFSKNIITIFSYSNIPNMISLKIWANTARESEEIQNGLQSLGFKDIIPHIGISGDFFDCWIDQLLRTK